MAARKTSANRVAGTLETKPITSVSQEISKTFLIEKVIPAIKENWPRDEIMIQFSFNKTTQDATLMRMTVNFVKLPWKMGLIFD